jgi:hypothetical protein
LPGFARSYGSALKARPTFGLLEAAQSAALCFFPALDKDERYVTEIRNKIDGGGGLDTSRRRIGTSDAWKY